MTIRSVIQSLATILVLHLASHEAIAAPIVTHVLTDVVPLSPLGWTADFTVPGAAPDIGGSRLLSAEVYATLDVRTYLTGRTSVEGFYGYWSGWSTKISAASGACCEGRIDSGLQMYATLDPGNNSSFVLSGVTVDEFNMNPITDPAVLAIWAGGGLVSLSMEVFGPSLVYVWEPESDVYMPDPTAPGRAVGHWSDCTICTGIGPEMSRYFFDPEVQIWAALKEVRVTYTYADSASIPEPATTALVVLGFCAMLATSARRLSA